MDLFSGFSSLKFLFTSDFPAGNQLAGNYTIIQLCIMLLFGILEFYVPNAGVRKKSVDYLNNLKVYLFNFLWVPVAGLIFAGFFVPISAKLGVGFIDLSFMGAYGLPGIVLQFLLSFLVFDFFYYWMHRLTHVNVWLWQQHKVHHLDRSVSSMFRDNFLEPVFEWIAITIPMSILFKFSPLNAYIFSLTAGTLIVWIHFNAKVRLGWANRLIASPQFHRIHHSTDPVKFMSNYATYFPIWDIVFGTYTHPEANEFPETGVEDQPDIYSLGSAQAYPFKRWAKMLRVVFSDEKFNKNNYW